MLYFSERYVILCFWGKEGKDLLWFLSIITLGGYQIRSAYSLFTFNFSTFYRLQHQYPWRLSLSVLTTISPTQRTMSLRCTPMKTTTNLRETRENLSVSSDKDKVHIHIPSPYPTTPEFPDLLYDERKMFYSMITMRLRETREHFVVS